MEKCGTEADKTALPDATCRNHPHQRKRIRQPSICSFSWVNRVNCRQPTTTSSATAIAASSNATPSIHMGETGVPAEDAEVTAVASTTTSCERHPAGPAVNADAFGDTFAQQDISNEARQRERKHARLRG
eukprot:scaffold36321_cov63-Attheya_sp.AAC.6